MVFPDHLDQPGRTILTSESSGLKQDKWDDRLDTLFLQG